MSNEKQHTSMPSRPLRQNRQRRSHQWSRNSFDQIGQKKKKKKQKKTDYDIAGPESRGFFTKRDEEKFVLKNATEPPCRPRATTPMPHGTGLGGCDPGFTPAQCSLYKLGIRAIKQEETCHKLSFAWEKDVRRINREQRATSKDCAEINDRYSLGIMNQCCVDIWMQGCAFTLVRGGGNANSSACLQTPPPFQNSNTACHYASARFEDGTYVGKETVQNLEQTNFLRCTKWASAHHLSTVLNSREIGFQLPMPSGEDSSEEMDVDPLPAMKAKAAMTKTGEAPGEVDPLQPKEEERFSDLGESSFYDVSNGKNGRSGLSSSKQAKFKHFETTLSVITEAKKEVTCKFCAPKLRRSLIVGTTNDGCDGDASRVCEVKKTLRCERICFLIGHRGRLSKGESHWKQAFTKRHCPVGKIMRHHSFNSSDSSSTEDAVVNITDSASLFTKQDVPVKAPVTLQKVSESMDHLPPAVQMRVMSDNYGTDDKGLSLCCFPGCVLPKRLEDGTDNPWYWYDGTRTMQEAVSAEMAHLF